MAAGISLRVSPKSKDGDFKVHYEALKDHILFECMDDSGREQGLAIGIIMKKYVQDDDGAFIQVRYVQCSDDYYRHWVEKEGANLLFHHLCRQVTSSCKRKVGRDSIVHVQRWTGITEDEAVSVLREWRLKPLPAPKGPVHGRNLVEMPITTSSKSKARKKKKGDGLDTSDFDSSAPPSPSMEARDERAGVRKVLEGRGDDAGHRHKRRGGDEEKKSKKKRSPEKKRSKPRTTALDAVVDDRSEEGFGDPGYNEKRLELLRGRLGEAKRNTDSKKGPSAVLAARIKNEGEEDAREKKKKKKDANVVLTALQTLAKKRKHSSSDDSSKDEDDDEALGGSKGSSGNMASKQRKLRRMSQENPGCLLLRGYCLMHETLGALYGSGGGSSRDAEKVLQPAAVRYLLTCALPQIDTRLLGEEKMRELRTLSTALDSLVSGQASSAADVMMQRFKSILIGIRDNTTAASKYLEIIPSELFPTGTTEAEGLPKGYGSDALAAIQHFLPETAGKLRNSWRLLKAWNKMEPPTRVLPISPLMIAGMAGLCARLGWCGPAAALLVGFDCLLRPGEIYELKVGDVTWAAGRATLTLHSAKTGQRKGAEEMVFCESHLATKWLRKACAGRGPSDYIIDRTRLQFRTLFFNLLTHFDITGNLSLYSLRRGGATWHFLGERSMESALTRGRWQSTSTARIYLADAAATLVHLQLTQRQTSALTTCSSFL
eukprot:Skav211256  [mRNA]  locus=scaffold3676:135811:142394:+ [translate_table: standard]